MVNLIGISSNLDNTVVGFAYGLKKIRFPFWVNLMVNFIGFCTALLGSYVGADISRYISPREAAWTSFCVLCSMGIFIICSEYSSRAFSKQREIKIQEPGIRQGLLLGFSLSLTNIVTGFGVTISNYSIIWSAVISITVWGYIAIWFGNKMGNGRIAKLLNQYSSLVAGLLFILLAFHQIL